MVATKAVSQVTVTPARRKRRPRLEGMRTRTPGKTARGSGLNPAHRPAGPRKDALAVGGDQKRRRQRRRGRHQAVCVDLPRVGKNGQRRHGPDNLPAVCGWSSGACQKPRRGLRDALCDRGQTLQLARKGGRRDLVSVKNVPDEFHRLVSGFVFLAAAWADAPRRISASAVQDGVSLGPPRRALAAPGCFACCKTTSAAL